MAYPRHVASRNHKRVRRSSGDITLNGNTWQEIAAESGGPGTGGFDLTIGAQIGDVLMGWMNAALSSAAVTVYFDLHTLVSGSPLNSFAQAGAVLASGTSGGAGGWYVLASIEREIGGPPLTYTVVSGDIVSNTVTVRPMFIGASATNRTLFANTASGPIFAFNLVNLGPPDPN